MHEPARRWEKEKTEMEKKRKPDAKLRFPLSLRRKKIPFPLGFHAFLVFPRLLETAVVENTNELEVRSLAPLRFC